MSGLPEDTQRLNASYTLALNAINEEDFETAKEYIDVCFVYQSADLKLGGTLSADAKSTDSFTVNADASGSKESEKAGMGAGIAVAVNGADTVAAVEDGTKLSGKNKSGNMNPGKIDKTMNDRQKADAGG